MSFRHHLLDLIDQTGVSDREISRLATGNIYAVRNIRRGTSPRLDTLEVLCRALGVRLEMVPLDEPGQASDGARSVAKLPEWSGRLREEIRRDLIEILGRDCNGALQTARPAALRGELGLRRYPSS